MKKLSYFILLLCAVFSVSCSKDEPEISQKPGEEQPSQPDEDQNKPSDDILNITINEDGTTSNGQPYRNISDTEFWLNYIRYQVVGGHISVVEADYQEIGLTLNGEVIIPESINLKGNKYYVREIGPSAFDNCQSIESCYLPESLNQINRCAFKNCTNLTTIKYPKKIDEIYESAFKQSGIRSFECSSVNIIRSECFASCENLGQVVIHSADSIGQSCFASCENLQHVTFNNTNTLKLGGSLFEGCINLHELELNNVVVYGFAFYGCDKLNLKLNNAVLKYSSLNSKASSIHIKNSVIGTRAASIYYPDISKKISITSSTIKPDAFNEVFIDTIILDNIQLQSNIFKNCRIRSISILGFETVPESLIYQYDKDYPSRYQLFNVKISGVKSLTLPFATPPIIKNLFIDNVKEFIYNKNTYQAVDNLYVPDTISQETLDIYKSYEFKRSIGYKNLNVVPLGEYISLFDQFTEGL
ncbi:MAG: leucine-rich repeat domain-containing protein [Muribaculaceae bacterium]|nr:leucine-rich repeat domain-containing protein [Muribaculaceae bacterium]